MNNQKKKNQNGFGRIFCRIVLVIALITFGYAAFQLGSIYVEYYKGQSEYEDIRESFKTTKIAAADKTTAVVGESGSTQNSQAAAAVEVDFPVYPAKQGPITINGVTLDMLLGVKYSFDFDALRRLNPEVMAWVQIEGTNIDYPVVQTTDNEKYLRQTLTGEWNNAGTVFADYRNVDPFNERNTIIHGHNQRNHMMFHDLVNYADPAYMQEHPYISIYTPDGKCRVYQIFAAYRTGDVSETYFCEFESDAQYQVYLDYIKSQQMYDTGISVTTANKIITLSTCTNDWEEGREVIHGKLINEK